MHLWHYERLSELLGKLQARFPEPVWRELGQAVAQHAARVALPRSGRGPPPSQEMWAEWDRPFDTVPGENVQGTVFTPQTVHCAAGSLVEGAIWAGGGVTADRDVVVEGPIVCREQIDWQGRRAQTLIAPRIRLGRPAFPLDIQGSILCQTLALGADASLSGTIGGSLVATGRIAHQESGQAIGSLLVLAGASAEGLDVPCAVALEEGVEVGHLCAGGNVVLGEACRAESVSGNHVVLGTGCAVSHVYARGTLVLGPGSVVQTAIAQGRITVDESARVEGDLIASASGEVKSAGQGWLGDPACQYRANVAALLDPSAQAGPLQGWAAVRSLPHSLYRQLEGLHAGWCPTLRPIELSWREEAR